MKVRERLAEAGFDRVENFILFAIAISTFATGAGFWVGISIGHWQMPLGVVLSMSLAMAVSWKMAAKCLSLAIFCLALSSYCFSYSGIDASVYHVPVQRLLIDGWNPVFQSSLEDVRALTGGECMLYHAAFLPRFAEMVGALVAKASGLYVADTWMHFFAIYLIGAAAFRFARLQWNCSARSAFLFGVFAALPSQIGTMMGSMIDYCLYAFLGSALLSIFNWERTRRNGDLVELFLCLAFAMLMKFTGVVIACLILSGVAIRNIRERWLTGILILFVVFVAVVGAAPYLTSWVRYGSPFYPTHSFNPAVQLVDITDDFTSNADGASMGYLSRIVYAWFSTKLACLGCAWWQGKDAFRPEFYVPVGVDGLKTWFRVLMWLSVGALALSKKNRVTVLCGVIFVLMNLAPLKYIGFGRYFMLMWLIPALSMYNLVYNPVEWLGTTMQYGRFGIYALFAGLSLMVAAKTAGLYLRAIGLEGARQIVFREAAECGATFEADRPGRGFGIHEKLTKVDGVDYQASDEKCPVHKFDSFLYFPHGFSISPNEVYADYPKCDSVQDVSRFRFDKLIGNLPHILWAKKQ